jgi:hypothetical protein
MKQKIIKKIRTKMIKRKEKEKEKVKTRIHRAMELIDGSIQPPFLYCIAKMTQ